MVYFMVQRKSQRSFAKGFIIQRFGAAFIAALLANAGFSGAVAAQQLPAAFGQAKAGYSGEYASSRPGPSYADLADLADRAELVVRAKVRKQVRLSPDRAPDVKPGYARLYVEADTQGLLSGHGVLGESLRYLVDVPLDSRGNVPKLKKQDVLLFARSVPGRPGELRLVGPGAQSLWDENTAAQLRPILYELAQPATPAPVTGIRDALSVAGNLQGESETQIFLTTRDGSPASITVVRRPGMPPQWGVSWSDIVDQSAVPPRPNTIGWYRLACSLPKSLPSSAVLSADDVTAARAAADYQFVRDSLGPCGRTQMQ